jgi:hypothetical protein
LFSDISCSLQKQSLCFSTPDFAEGCDIEHISSAGVRSGGGRNMRIMEGGKMKEIWHSVSGGGLRDAAPGSYGTPVRDLPHISITNSIELNTNREATRC